MRALYILLLCGLACACTDESTPASGPASPDSSSDTLSSTAVSAGRMAQWSRNCALCHVRGEGGAPVLGDREAWAPRIAQGEDVMLQHTVEGLNNMPPLGYCMDCEEDDFRQLIRFMGGET